MKAQAQVVVQQVQAVLQQVVVQNQAPASLVSLAQMMISINLMEHYQMDKDGLR